MVSIRGVYTGQDIQPLEAIPARPNVRVIITFLEDEPLTAEAEKEAAQQAVKTPTQAFLEKCGGWQDIRSPEEIIADIYAARTMSDRGARVFMEEVS